jgi:hypothetical protein
MQRMQMRVGRASALMVALFAAPRALHAQVSVAPAQTEPAHAAAPHASKAAIEAPEAPPADGVPAAAPTNEATAAVPQADDAPAAPQASDATAAESPADDDVAAAPPPAAVPASAQRRAAELQLELQRVSAQRVNNLWPWLTVTVGASATLVAAASGAVYTLACSAECNSPAWVSMLVVIGAGVATLGTIWLLRINADNNQVESRQHQLERELERFDHAARQRDRLQARAAPVVSLHF